MAKAKAFLSESQEAGLDLDPLHLTRHGTCSPRDFDYQLINLQTEFNLIFSNNQTLNDNETKLKELINNLLNQKIECVS